ncbi:STAS domain-containing protein [Micromonospora sp. DT47]|uniref:STAS domain-containing protein n=1 Tax=Micromonospora sp. DT47 TaxID=3393431 RepID=UPI003CE6FD74
MHSDGPHLHSTSTTGLQLTRIRVDAGRLRVRVAGEVDLATAGELRDALDVALDGLTGTVLEVDLEDVRFLDSSGVLVLLTAHARAAGQDCPLVVSNAQSGVLRVLEITGVSAMLIGD